MRNFLLAAFFITALSTGCSNDEQVQANEITTKSESCIPVTGENGINAEAVGRGRKLFITWNQNIPTDFNLMYDAKVIVTNQGCNGGTPQIMDEYPISLLGSNSLALHNLANTCFDWRIVVKVYSESSMGVPLCTTSTPWVNHPAQ